MEELVKQRIKSVLAHYKLTQNAFAGSDKAFQKRLSSQLNGASALSFQTINSILEAFPEVSAEWLLRGAGSMLREENTIGIINNTNSIGKQEAKNISNGSGDINVTGNDIVGKLLEQNAMLIEMLKGKME